MFVVDVLDIDTIVQSLVPTPMILRDIDDNTKKLVLSKG